MATQNGVVASLTGRDISLRAKKAFVPEPPAEV